MNICGWLIGILCVDRQQHKKSKNSSSAFSKPSSNAKSVRENSKFENLLKEITDFKSTSGQRSESVAALADRTVTGLANEIADESFAALTTNYGGKLGSGETVTTIVDALLPPVK